MMNINPMPRRCTYCGKTIIRGAETEHFLRKRNSLSLVNDSCAACNRKYLEQWDTAGELPTGPLDSLLNVARRSQLVAERLGDSVNASAFKLLQLKGRRSEGKKSSRRRMRAANKSENQVMITAIADEASRIRQLWEYLEPGIRWISPVDYDLWLIYARRVEKNPALFIEWWESVDHEAIMQATGAILQIATDYDMDHEMDFYKVMQLAFRVQANEASVFLVWLRNRTRQLVRVL